MHSHKVRKQKESWLFLKLTDSFSTNYKLISSLNVKNAVSKMSVLIISDERVKTCKQVDFYYICIKQQSQLLVFRFQHHQLLLSDKSRKWNTLLCQFRLWFIESVMSLACYALHAILHHCPVPFTLHSNKTTIRALLESNKYPS